MATVLEAHTSRQSVLISLRGWQIYGLFCYDIVQFRNTIFCLAEHLRIQNNPFLSFRILVNNRCKYGRKSSTHYLGDKNRFDVSSKGPSSGISVGGRGKHACFYTSEYIKTARDKINTNQMDLIKTRNK